MSRPLTSTSDMLPMPETVRVEVTVHRSQMVTGTFVEGTVTSQAGVLVAVGVLVGVNVPVGVLVVPTVGQTPLLLMTKPQARNVPISPPALSVTVSVQVPLPFCPLKVASVPAPVPPGLNVPFAGTGQTAATEVGAASSRVMLLKSANGAVLHTCPIIRTSVPLGEDSDTRRSPT